MVVETANVKDFVRYVFDQNKRAMHAQDLISDLGLCIGDGLFSDITDGWYPCLNLVTRDDVTDNDEFIDDFRYFADFEEFWNKYYEGSI